MASSSSSSSTAAAAAAATAARVGPGKENDYNQKITITQPSPQGGIVHKEIKERRRGLIRNNGNGNGNGSLCSNSNINIAHNSNRQEESINGGYCGYHQEGSLMGEKGQLLEQQQQRNSAIISNDNTTTDNLDLGGVRLCYFDETNVLNGATATATVATHGGVGSVAAGAGGGTATATTTTTTHYEDFNEEDYLVLPTTNSNRTTPNDMMNNQDNPNDSHADDIDIDDNDDCSEASGDTVVHNDNVDNNDIIDIDCPPPPPNATRAELNLHYWQWCYGTTINAVQVQSTNGLKSAPPKSCLSTKKKSNHPGNTSMTPRRILHHSPVYVHVPSNDINADNANAVVLPLDRRPSTPTEEDLTPKNNITRLGLVDPTNNNNNSTTSINTLRTKEHQHSSSVKFGNNTAAEFDSTLPITEMTPIPSSVVQQIFPLELLDVQNVQKQQEEYGVSRETARNVALLAEWDDDFDEIIVGGDNGGEAPSRGRSGRSRRGQKRHTPYKLTGGRRNSSARRPRKERRRESSIFSRGGGSLVDPIIDNDDFDNTAMDDSAGGTTAAATTTTTNNGNGLNDSMEMDESLTHDAINDINGHSSAAISGRRNRRRRGGSASRGSAGSGGRDSLLPLSVTIGPEEYTSPSSASVSTLGSTPSVATENDELEQPTATSSAGGGGNDDVRRESLESACISPNSSLAAAASATTAVGKSSKTNPNNGAINGSNRRESNASCCSSSTTTSGKETPNSARRSSSTILRAVHADGGAVLVAVTGAAGSNNGGLQPNQLKYSPSSSSGSSGGSSSSTSTLRMDISPASDASGESLGSEIMSLFTHHSIVDHSPSVSSNEDENVNDPLRLSNRIEKFSNHATQPFHTSIRDLYIWMKSKQIMMNDPEGFMNEEILKGLSPQTFLALCNGDDCSNVGSLCQTGRSDWIQSVLFESNVKSSFMQRNFESILLHEMNVLTSSRSSASKGLSQINSPMITVDAEFETIISCIQQFYQKASVDWSSMELDTATRALDRLQQLAKLKENETNGCNEYVAMGCRKLKDAATMTMQALSASGNAAVPSAKKTLDARKRKIQSQIQDEESQIKILEEQLTEEVDRLDEAKRAKRVFDAHLENARNSPVSVLYEETQCDILPVPRYRPETGNESEWKYSLLGDSAEVHFTFGDISASEPVEQLRCHIRDGGASIKLLQALLLGNIDAYESSGPFPLRESLTTCILQQDGLDDQILLMSFLFSRIDALVRSVRELETNSFCKVIQSPKSGDDVILSISMSHEGTVIQFWFLFEKLSSKDWQVKTVPSDVKVSIVSTTQDMSALGSQLQDNAQHILAGSSSSDPILMRTICGQVLKCFVEAMTG